LKGDLIWPNISTVAPGSPLSDRSVRKMPSSESKDNSEDVKVALRRRVLYVRDERYPLPVAVAR